MAKIAAGDWWWDDEDIVVAATDVVPQIKWPGKLFTEDGWNPLGFELEGWPVAQGED